MTTQKSLLITASLALATNLVAASEVSVGSVPSIKKLVKLKIFRKPDGAALDIALDSFDLQMGPKIMSYSDALTSCDSTMSPISPSSIVEERFRTVSTSPISDLSESPCVSVADTSASPITDSVHDSPASLIHDSVHDSAETPHTESNPKPMLMTHADLKTFIKMGDLEAIKRVPKKYLFRRFSKKLDSSGKGMHPLHFALLNKQISVAEFLIESAKGDAAALEAKDLTGAKPIEYAVAYCPELTRRFLPGPENKAEWQALDVKRFAQITSRAGVDFSKNAHLTVFDALLPQTPAIDFAKRFTFLTAEKIEIGGEELKEMLIEFLQHVHGSSASVFKDLIVKIVSENQSETLEALLESSELKPLIFNESTDVFSAAIKKAVEKRNNTVLALLLKYKPENLAIPHQSGDGDKFEDRICKSLLNIARNRSGTEKERKYMVALTGNAQDVQELPLKCQHIALLFNPNLSDQEFSEIFTASVVKDKLLIKVPKFGVSAAKQAKLIQKSFAIDPEQMSAIKDAIFELSGVSTNSYLKLNGTIPEHFEMREFMSDIRGIFELHQFTYLLHKNSHIWTSEQCALDDLSDMMLTLSADKEANIQDLLEAIKAVQNTPLGNSWSDEKPKLDDYSSEERSILSKIPGFKQLYASF